jgi:uncharacterized protein YndB with AHSA1/START domain
MTDATGGTFVYVTFIRTTPLKLWSALTDPEIMKQCWFGHPPGVRLADRLALETGVPRGRIASWYRWRNEFKPELKVEDPARSTYEFEPMGSAVKLTITHSIDRPRSKLFESVSGGWPHILSNLKSLLETGQTILS